MENNSREKFYLIDLSYALTPADIVFELSTILEQELAWNQEVFLRLGNVDLNQSQLLSIKSLINSINSNLAYISSESKQTELAAITIGLMVSNEEKEAEQDEPSAQYVPMTEHLDIEEKVDESNLETDSDEAKSIVESVETEAGNTEENVESGYLSEVSADKAEAVESIEETVSEDKSVIEEVSPVEEVIDETDSTESIDSGIEGSTESLENQEIQAQLDSIFDSEIKLESILGAEKENYPQAKEGFEVEVPEEEELTEEDFAIRSMTTKYIKQTVRSGQVIKYDGNLIIIGDCHPGSEIHAQGDITVWGALGGIAHAGYKGNTKARIRALQLNAIQLRIGELFARRPDMIGTAFVEKSNTVTPEEARIINNSIVILKLND